MSMRTNVGTQAAVNLPVAVAPSAARLVERAWRVVAVVLLHRAMWKAEADLMALSDRTLKDIGLHRSGVRSAVREVFGPGDLATRLSGSAQS